MTDVEGTLHRVLREALAEAGTKRNEGELTHEWLVDHADRLERAVRSTVGREIEVTFEQIAPLAENAGSEHYRSGFDSGWRAARSAVVMPFRAVMKVMV